MQRVGILGGTFNPVHIGHIRPAIEVFEALHPDTIDLLPCATPPHKTAGLLLPFELRVQLLAAAAEPFPFLRINDMENTRSGPSYTYDTLLAYKTAAPENEHFFILGSGDFFTLPNWHKGLELTDLANIVVLPRSGNDINAFHAKMGIFWPDAVSEKAKAPLAAVYRLPSGHKIYFLPQPRLDISATLIRERWLAGKDVTYLVPGPVLQIMQAHRDAITCHWHGQPTE